jgi:hypothetical protein
MKVTQIKSRTVKTYMLIIEDGEVRALPYSRVGARYQIERVEVVKRDGTVLSVKAFGSALKKDGSVGKNAASEYMHSQSAWPQWLRDVIDGLA